MTTSRKVSSNRLNALKSTGPRTNAGKAASRLNALSHGLSADVRADPAYSDQVKGLREALLHVTHGDLNLAERLASAEVDLLRIRRLRTKAMSVGQHDGGLEKRSGISHEILDRYERRAFSRRARVRTHY